MGQIITFFSYKGGVGRTMALANVATVLAQWGYKVLMVDWDLEAPGLENFFRDALDLEKAEHAKGLLDCLGGSLEPPENDGQPGWKDLVLPVALPGVQGALHLLTSGDRNGEYFQRVRNLDLQLFYTEHNGGAFIESLRNEWKKDYDFILLDSRTGITDIGGICTIQLPDVIVLLFTATEQAFGGALDVVKKAALARQKLPYERLQVPVVPIPSRFDTQREFKLSQEWLRRFSEGLSDLYSSWLPTSVDKLELLELTKLPYISYFSFGEKLPVLEQGTNDPAGLGYAYETLAGLLANQLERVELLMENRSAFLREAAHPARARRSSRVLLCYSHRDESWAQSLVLELLPLDQQRLLVLWSDQRISAGHGWHQEFRKDVGVASLVLVLCSNHFLKSAWSGQEVFAWILDAEIPVLPVLVSHCDWSSLGLSQFQTLPSKGRVLTELSDFQRDEALAAIGRKVLDILVVSTEPPREGFYAFLSYHGQDAAAARALAEKLRDRDLRVWFYERDLALSSSLGKSLEETILEVVLAARSVLVLVGPSGLSSTQRWILRASVGTRDTRMIPVLLPGAAPAQIGSLLKFYAWVDFRAGLSEEGLDQLVWGITGAKPARGTTAGLLP